MFYIFFFKLLLPDPTTSTSPHFIYGDLPMNMSKEVILNVLDNLNKSREECFPGLEEALRMNPNPYIQKSLNAEWKYPPCIRYTGGPAGAGHTGKGWDMEKNFRNHYFKGANWNGSGWANAHSYFYEGCLYVDEKGEVANYPYGIANPAMYDSPGNEMGLSGLFSDSTEPPRYLDLVGKNGDRLVWCTDWYNKIIDKYKITERNKLEYLDRYIY